MRPNEIDYTSRLKHFYDVSNGEILAGSASVSDYVKEAETSRDNIIDLGQLLRGQHEVAIPAGNEATDASEWSSNEYIRYGRWLASIVAPPVNPRERQLNRHVFRRAYHIGVGPSEKSMIKTLGGYSAMYIEIGLQNVHVVGAAYTEWCLDDYIADLRYAGGSTQRRPSWNELERRSKLDRNKPTPDYMARTFRHIGGLNKLLELAGYPVIDLWNEQDYIDWGVKFMMANDGVPPTALMADYLSGKRQGPSHTAICNNFTKMRNYQKQVICAYVEARYDQISEEAEIVAAIAADIKQKNIPCELFEEDTINVQNMPTDMVIKTLKTAARKGEFLTSYAKFKVIERIVPGMGVDRRLAVSKDATGNFISAVRKHSDVSPADIEHAALTMGYFDFIWPIDDYKHKLKLDEGYVDYYNKIKRAPKKLLVQAA